MEWGYIVEQQLLTFWGGLDPLEKLMEGVLSQKTQGHILHTPSGVHGLQVKKPCSAQKKHLRRNRQSQTYRFTSQSCHSSADILEKQN